MKLPPYPKYKPSGVEWIGDVPEHWKVLPLRRLAQLKSGEAITTEEMLDGGDYPVFGGNGLRGFTTAFTHRGDYVLIGRQGALCGNVNFASGHFWASEHAVVVSPLQSWSTRWMGELLRAMNLNQYSQSAAQPGLSVERILGLSLPLPPIDEQEAIAAFLDRQTNRINGLVATKRTLLERLNEKRTALISRTVTRGLPPNPARAAGLEPHPTLKPSGIDWVGEMPGHWEISKGRFLGSLIGSATIAEEDLNEDGEGSLFAKVDDLNYVTSSLVLQTTRFQVATMTAKHRQFLLFPKRGAAIFTNKVVIADGSVLFDSNLMGWEIVPTVDLKFVAYCLIARRLDDLADVSTVPQINNKHVYPAHFPLPPRIEQRAIAEFLDLETAKIDEMTIKVETAIERLQEYRAALITAVVTGKIDVRPAVPDEN